jgi:hypothetical protein
VNNFQGSLFNYLVFFYHFVTEALYPEQQRKTPSAMAGFSLSVWKNKEAPGD